MNLYVIFKEKSILLLFMNYLFGISKKKNWEFLKMSIVFWNKVSYIDYVIFLRQNLILKYCVFYY